MATKKQIRALLKDQRGALTSRFREDAAARILERVLEREEVQSARRVMLYSDFANEVPTAQLTGMLMYLGKEVFLPTMHENKIVAMRVKNALFEQNGFGITQPKYCAESACEPQKLDVIFVPGVAFDRAKNRLGFGKGYYDAFLRQAQSATTIALAYDFQIVGGIPAEEHDIPMNLIVTQEEIIV